MAVFIYWLTTLLLVLILKETIAFSDPCSELKREIDYLKKMNHRNEQLVLQYQEQLKNETQVSEVALKSLKLAEDQFKSKLQQKEGVIGSLKKQLEAKEEILKSDKKTQNELQATTDGLIKTLETQYLKEEEHYGQPKIATPILQVTLWLEWMVVILIMVWSGSISRFERHTAQRITELEHKYNTLEDQNYILKKQLEAKEKFLNFKFETQKQMQTTIDDLRMTEETNSRTIQELLQKGNNYKATIDDLTKILQPDICRRLLEAVKSVDVKTVKILCKYANDTYTTDDGYGNTPLTIAAIGGHVEMVRLLLESGANTERGNKFQRTALHRAADCRYLEVCRLLLDWGAKVDALDSSKCTPLHDAAREGSLSVVKLLVERGADVWARNCIGNTASDMARCAGKEDVAKWLELESRRCPFYNCGTDCQQLQNVQ